MISYDTLIAYIEGLHKDGNLSDEDYNAIILYILANGDLSTDARDLIQIRRGDSTALPQLAQGELGYCWDTKQLYIGGLDGNVLLSSQYPQFNNKRIAIVGDSISDTNWSPGNWPKFLKEMLPGTRIDVYSTSWATLTGADGLANVMRTLPVLYDTIIYFAGINDYNHQVPLGAINSYDLSTFNGALNNLADWKRANQPQAQLFYITPLRAMFKPGYTGDVIDFRYLETYIQCLYNACSYLNFSIIDAWSFGPYANYNVPSYRDLYLPDTIHPSSPTWHKLFANFVLGAISGSGTGIGFWSSIVDMSNLMKDGTKYQNTKCIAHLYNDHSLLTFFSDIMLPEAITVGNYYGILDLGSTFTGIISTDHLVAMNNITDGKKYFFNMAQILDSNSHRIVSLSPINSDIPAGPYSIQTEYDLGPLNYLRYGISDTITVG